MEVEDEKLKLDNGPVDNSQRYCTDMVCLVMFIVFMGGMGGIGYYAIRNGNFERVI